jgi:hypothetical protein
MLWIPVRDPVPFDPESRIRDPDPVSATLAAGHFKHFKDFPRKYVILKKNAKLLNFLVQKDRSGSEDTVSRKICD